MVELKNILNEKQKKLIRFIVIYFGGILLYVAGYLSSKGYIALLILVLLLGALLLYLGVL